MGQTHIVRHNCGYQLLREEIVDLVDVGHGLYLAEELRATLHRDEYAERCYLPIGMLLYWYDGTPDIENAELAKRQVTHCPQCGSALPPGAALET